MNSTTTSQIRFLLVEDEIISQFIFKTLVSTMGHSVDVAHNAELAFQLLGEKSYELIFMDLGLPDKPGLEIVKELRTKWKLETPVIALTAQGSDLSEAKCLNSGFNLFLEKPITKEKLNKVLSTMELLAPA